MAHYVVNELLCFFKNNFDKWTMSELKVVMLNFNNDEEIVAGKDMLLKALLQAAKDIGTELDLSLIHI